MSRRRKNIEKQEKLVTALWDVVWKNQIALAENRPMISSSGGARMSDPAIREAILTIMDIFGYDVVEVQ